MIVLDVFPFICLSVGLLSVVTMRVVIEPGVVFCVVTDQFDGVFAMGEDAVNERTMHG